MFSIKNEVLATAVTVLLGILTKQSVGLSIVLGLLVISVVSIIRFTLFLTLFLHADFFKELHLARVNNAMEKSIVHRVIYQIVDVRSLLNLGPACMVGIRHLVISDVVSITAWMLAVIVYNRITILSA